MYLRPAPFVIAAFALALTTSLESQQPTFRSGVDLIRLDVQVVSDDGTPVTDLTADDFEIVVNGRACRVRSLRFLDLAATEAPPTEIPSVDVSTNAMAMRGRLTVIVVDENSLPEDTRPLMEGVSDFLKKLGPNDQTALVVLPRPGLYKDFTTDHGELEALLKRTSSRSDKDVNKSKLVGSLPQDGSEAGAIPLSVRLGQVAVDRGETAAPLFKAGSATDPNRDLIYALEQLARRLRSVEGPKTLLLISGSLPESVGLDDYHSFANEAAAAHLTIYVLKPAAMNGAASSYTSAIEQQFQAQNGLDYLAGMAGGVILNAVGTAHGALDRIARETSGSYLLGVEPPPDAPRNKPLAVTVKLKRDGLVVRSPRQVASAAAGSEKHAGSTKEMLGTLLHDPRLATDLPLRVTSYTARGADRNRMKALIVAELDSPGGKDVSWGFEVHDGLRLISDAFDKVSLKTLVGEPLVTSASLPPGKYTMRFGVVDDQGRRASVDRPLTVGLHLAAVDGLEFSDVFVGVAANNHFKPRITVDPDIAQVIAFVEVYSASRAAFDKLAVEFALRGEDGANRSATRARVQRAMNSAAPKGIAEGGLQLRHAGPGRYTVTAAILLNGKPVGFTKRDLVLGPAH
jgi:VWFA-related protein